MRLIIHAGFHKTGTSTVQDCLLQNRAALAGHAAIFLRDDILPIVKAARRFSIQRDKASLKAFARKCRLWLSTLDAPANTVLIATEDIAGSMPGRIGVTDYGALPDLMRSFEGVARDRFGEALELTVYLSTRAPEPWIESLWWQHLRATRFSASLEEYLDEARPAAALLDIVEAVRAALPHSTVVSHALEEMTGAPEGPMTPIYDLLDAPPALRVPPDGVKNSRYDVGLEPVFLALNRSGLPDDIVQDTKRQVLRALRMRLE